MSSAGASILALSYLLPPCYLLWSLRRGKRAGRNPWRAAGLEWLSESPPPTHNFEQQPRATREAYHYDQLDCRLRAPAGTDVSVDAAAAHRGPLRHVAVPGNPDPESGSAARR